MLCWCDYSELVVATLHTKPDLNNTVEIYAFLLHVFYQNMLVLQHRLYHCPNQNHEHAMLFFNTFFWWHQIGCSYHSLARKTHHWIIESSTNYSSNLCTIWDNIDGYDEHYRCATALFLLSVMSQAYDIIIYLGFSATGHGI